MIARTMVVVFTLAALAATNLPAQTGLPVELRGVDFEQKLEAQVAHDLPFRDEDGRPVTLADYFNDKPIILLLAYFRCPMLCDRVLNGLTRTMLDMPFDVGKDYRVLTVSFDPTETPEMARVKKQTYLDRYGRPGATEGWRFLTGDAAAIEQLANCVGFRYRYDAKHQQFAHAAGIVILTPGGKVARYFFDIRYSPRDVRLSLVEASANRIGSAADRVLLFCFHYDPETGRYGPAVMNIVRAGGVLTIVGVGMFASFLWRRERRAWRKSLAGERT